LAESLNRVTIKFRGNYFNILSETIYTDIILTKLVIDKIITFLDEYYVVIPEQAISKETIVTIAPERSIPCQ